jgi:hypothetical protein
MRDKSLLVLASSFELATGVVAVAAPGLVAKVLFSVDLTAGEKATSRLWGFGLLSLSIACWPRDGEDYTQATRALFLYNALAFCYLGYLRIVGEFSSFSFAGLYCSWIADAAVCPSGVRRRDRKVRRLDVRQGSVESLCMLCW